VRRRFGEIIHHLASTFNTPVQRFGEKYLP
jgi:hypothetical protein